MQSVPLAWSVLCSGLGDSIRRWTQLPALGPVKPEYVPDRTQSDRQSQVWEGSSCSIHDYTLQTNSRRLPSIICKDNRCTLNTKENALKMFWPKNYLFIRKEENCVRLVEILLPNFFINTDSLPTEFMWKIYISYI